jgi:hypothetical protein
VHRLLAGALLILLSPVAWVPARGQDLAPTPRPRSEFFSGVVTAFSSDQITVVRTVPHKISETRTFAIHKETRVEGKLALKVRVTVRYVRGEEGDRALHIIVRVSQKK